MDLMKLIEMVDEHQRMAEVRREFKQRPIPIQEMTHIDEMSKCHTCGRQYILPMRAVEGWIDRWKGVEHDECGHHHAGASWWVVNATPHWPDRNTRWAPRALTKDWPVLVCGDIHEGECIAREVEAALHDS